MADELLTIEATDRQTKGKGYCRKLRRAGKIPANLLDKGKSTLIELDPKLLSKAYKTGGRKFKLNYAGASKVVLIKELQIHAIKRTAVHVDLVYEA